MMEIVETGPFNTVQDLGRPGFRDIGVSAGGAMDPLAASIGNILVGNPAGSATVEVQTFPFKLRFTVPSVFAVTGADGVYLLNGKEQLTWSARQAHGGDVLELRQPPKMARAYIAFAGGVDVPLLMGSRSTALRGNFGGVEGRSLTTGDILLLGADGDGLPLPTDGLAAVTPLRAMADAFPPVLEGVLQVRAIPAGEHHLFGEDAEAFWGREWRISSRSDRTGYRLTGDPIKPVMTVEMRSHGVVPGVVQVPPGGEPIIQMSDANTAGGYPKIAGVIEADLWRLGQARPGATIRFVRSSHDEARRVEKAVAAYIEDIRQTAPMVKRALKAMA